MTPPIHQGDPTHIVLVTGPAGAGRNTAINALEDFGFEAVDNIPLSMISRLVSGPPLERPMAIGIDLRTRDFSPEGVHAIYDEIAGMADRRPVLLYLDCAADVLLSRFSETRRRHPLADGDNPQAGIERDLELMAGLKDRADILIDTSDSTIHDLRRELAGWFERIGGADLAVELQSFSYKRGVPRGLDMVMDLRFLRNPHWEPELRPLDGRDAQVGRYVSEDPLFTEFFTKLMEITTLLLPAYKSEGKAHFSIGLGCTGGQHRSVFVTESLAKGLAEDGWRVSIRHRELERRGKLSAVSQG